MVKMVWYRVPGTLFTRVKGRIKKSRIFTHVKAKSRASAIEKGGKKLERTHRGKIRIKPNSVRRQAPK